MRQSRRRGAVLRAGVLCVLSLVVAVGQPLSALAMIESCSTCGHEETGAASCCCEPAEPPVAEPATGCCATEDAPPAEVEDSVAHRCSCRELPEIPVVPVTGPSPLDVDSAARASRAVAQALEIASTTRVAPVAGDEVPGACGGGGPPPSLEDVRGSPRLLRCVEKGLTTALAWLSVARI